MRRNNFQQLEFEKNENSPGPSPQVLRSIRHSMRSMKLIGGVFDHFIPKMLKVVLALLQSEALKSEKEYISNNSSNTSSNLEQNKYRYPNQP